VELLKQGQFVPMPVERQIVSIFVGTAGYLDGIPLERIGQFEEEFLEMMERKHQDLLEAIVQKKDLDDSLTARLHDITKEFLASFKH
jgi:F-type H+-transporting ATPase subunit alpha